MSKHYVIILNRQIAQGNAFVPARYISQRLFAPALLYWDTSD